MLHLVWLRSFIDPPPCPSPRRGRGTLLHERLRDLALIPIEGPPAEDGGQILRTALALAAGTGQGFEMVRIREKAARPGLRPEQVAAVRAAALVCSARVHGGFDGSPDLRFEPGAVAPGDFRFEMGQAGSAALVLQMVAPALAAASSASQVAMAGGTHVVASPSFDYVARHWTAVVASLGLRVRSTLTRAGFAPRGEGELQAEIGPWPRPSGPLLLEQRGSLAEVRGLSGSSRLKGDVARRQRDAAQAILWERRRIEAVWEVVDEPSASPGSFLLLEAVFEHGRGAFALLGERGIASEVLGERGARRLLRFIEDEEGAVDAHLADQLVVPLALAGCGGRVTTPEVTSHLVAAAVIASRFGIPASTWGRPGGPGGLDVGRC